MSEITPADDEFIYTCGQDGVVTRLLVVQDASDGSTVRAVETFVLNEETADVDDTQTDEVLRTMYEMEPDSPYSVPMYRILWTHLAANYPDHGSLLELIPLSERLSEHIRSADIDEIVIGEGAQRKYVPVVEDVAADCGCRVRDRTEVTPRGRVKSVIETLWNFLAQPLLLVVNQLVSASLPERGDTRRPVAMFPFPGRYDSTMPIARELAETVSCYVPHLGSDVFDWPDVDWNIPLYSYQRHSSLDIVRDEMSVFLELLSPWKRQAFADALCKVLSDELGVNLPRTIRYAVDLVIKRNARAILYYCWALDFLDDDVVAAVLVGGPAPRDMAILQAAFEHGKDAYYVHHSVVTGTEFLPRPAATYFVPSEIGAEHIRQIHGDADLPTLDVTGRPYIDERYGPADLDDSSSLRDTSKIVVMIATQPYRDKIRERFVRRIHDAVARSAVIDEVRIKLHPSESESFYKNLLKHSNREATPVSIADSGLEEEIGRSSLVVTINSNVGLEAMIQGTPAVCYNEWHPSIQNKPYTRADQIPVFDDAAGLTEYFESLTIDGLDDLRRDQTEYAREQFLAGGSAAERIADHILSRSVKSRMN